MVDVEFHGLDVVIEDFDKFNKVNNRAISRAMNDANRAGRKVAVSKQGMRKEWAIKSSDLKRYTWNTTANVNNLSTKFGMVSRSINLADFGAKWSMYTPTGKYTKGVSYKLKGKRRTMKGAFMAKGHVFSKRKGSKNIIPLFSITPTSMLKEAEADELYIKQYLSTFDKRYLNQLNHLTAKL